MSLDENENDPLDVLFIKGDGVSKELLRDVLLKYIRLDEKRRIFPLKPYYSETNKNKIILILLAQKVISLKIGDSEFISPKDLAKLMDIPEGSIRPTLRLLVEGRIVEDEGGKYRVIPVALQRIAEILSIERLGEKSTQQEERPSRIRKKVSMREVLQGLIEQGDLDDPKSAREIFNKVKQQRPGTIFNALYKVILDLISQRLLKREIRENTWVYWKASP